MGEMQTLLQEPISVLHIVVAVILGVVWLAIMVLVVRWVAKRLAALRSAFSLMAKADPESVAAAMEKLAPGMNLKAVSPATAKSMRDNLAKKLRVPAEMISSYTVGGQLAVHGVSPETIQVVEQVLRGGEEQSREEQRFGFAPPAASEITVLDVWKAARELDERLRNR